VRNRLLWNDSKRIRFHEVIDGEITIADESVVLEMVLDESVGMIIYDRNRRLAAASKLALQPEDGSTASIHERTGSASLALLSRLAQRGCDPDSLEIYALGAVDTDSLSGSAKGLRRVSMAMGLSSKSEARRVEFDVGVGRIVVEQMVRTKA